MIALFVLSLRTHSVRPVLSLTSRKTRTISAIPSLLSLLRASLPTSSPPPYNHLRALKTLTMHSMPPPLQCTPSQRTWKPKTTPRIRTKISVLTCLPYQNQAKKSANTHLIKLPYARELLRRLPLSFQKGSPEHRNQKSEYHIIVR